jgi:segregation and condensation protein A
MSDTDHYSRFFEVRVELFDGPLDLLLHLVKKRELPIEKLSLSEVTGQYLECIKRLKYFDVELAAEYLVIAATLLSIKASIVLNDPVELVVDETGELVDPQEELVARLKELEAFRAAAGVLSARPTLGSEVFAPPAKSMKLDPSLVPLADHSSELLARAFQSVLSRLGERAAVYSITIDTVSVVDRMRSVVDSLKECGGQGTFVTLVGANPDRGSVIGIFIALLELCRRRMIIVTQEDALGEIVIALPEKKGHASEGSIENGENGAGVVVGVQNPENEDTVAVQADEVVSPVPEVAA